jgi:hypothetical protein
MKSINEEIWVIRLNYFEKNIQKEMLSYYQMQILIFIQILFNIWQEYIHSNLRNKKNNL